MKVKIRFPLDIEMSVPDDWDKEQIEFHINESSWCVGNILPKLEKYADEHDGCLCCLLNERATLIEE